MLKIVAYASPKCEAINTYYTDVIWVQDEDKSSARENIKNDWHPFLCFDDKLTKVSTCMPVDFVITIEEV